MSLWACCRLRSLFWAPLPIASSRPCASQRQTKWQCCFCNYFSGVRGCCAGAGAGKQQRIGAGRSTEKTSVLYSGFEVHRATQGIATRGSELPQQLGAAHIRTTIRSSSRDTMAHGMPLPVPNKSMRRRRGLTPITSGRKTSTLSSLVILPPRAESSLAATGNGLETVPEEAMENLLIQGTCRIMQPTAGEPFESVQSGSVSKDKPLVIPLPTEGRRKPTHARRRSSPTASRRRCCVSRQFRRAGLRVLDTTASWLRLLGEHKGSHADREQVETCNQPTWV